MSREAVEGPSPHLGAVLRTALPRKALRILPSECVGGSALLLSVKGLVRIKITLILFLRESSALWPRATFVN